MPTLVAGRKNPWSRAHYDHLLAAGKWPKVAIVACMRKLLGAMDWIVGATVAFWCGTAGLSAGVTIDGTKDDAEHLC